MFGLKNFLSRTAQHLPEDLRAAVETWRATPAPALDEAHFHVRYVVVDIASSGFKPESDRLQALAATGVQQSGTLLPDDAFYLDCSGDDALATLDRQLLAFLQFAAKAPLVTYHVPYVGGFLQAAYRERLGINFQPQWIDLAWLLPAMFEEKWHTPQPLDYWLELFGMAGGSGRRDAMDNTLMLARVFQRLLVRATGKGILTAAGLIDESRASSFLRRTH
jgi:DNA polymerase-3 subunit epsilon